MDMALQFNNDIIISANNHDLDYLGFPVVHDIYGVNAPLAGIHAGLKFSRTEWNLVLTCDMPNVTKGMIDRLLAMLDEGLRMVVPQHNGFVEPLCGFYHMGLLPLIEANIAKKKFSLLKIPESAPYRFVILPDVTPEEIQFIFKNVNEKRDLLS